jgi:hypothetical protein
MQNQKSNSSEKKEPLKYSIQNLPFLLNYEYFSLAWGGEHKGYFIDVQGKILTYNMPEKWNYYISAEEYSENVFWGYETDGHISPKNLFENLNSLKNTSIDNCFVKININEMLKSLIESGFEYSFGGCDMGIRSYSILIFDKISGNYKRIILKTFGDKCITNKSSYTSELLKCFKNT